jgi:L-threonylcarbamoyladenylate synthase
VRARRIAFRSAAERTTHAAEIVAHLRGGGLIAYPTETVYGFGCLLRDDALSALARLKGRDEEKPFLLLVRDRADLEGVRWTDSARRLADAFWPGPLTMALAAESGHFPAAVLSRAGAVAVRLSPHAGVQAILESARGLLTSTSANRAGRPPALDADEAASVVEQLGAVERVLVVDGGRLAPSSPSTVVDCSGEPPRVLRAGAITMNALRAIVPEIDEPA